MLAPTRREALARLVMWLGAVPPAALGAWFAVRFLASRKRRRVVEVVAAPAAELPRDAALACDNIVGHRLVLRRDRGSVLAFSTVCPHMGCTVAWQETAREFVCPCHAGRFDARGEPLAGPVDRPLRRYPARERGGLIYVTLPAGEDT